jgi:hypothetical protein
MQLDFNYTAPIDETQTKTLQKSFHRLYRNPLKQFMELPSNLPSETTLGHILHFKNNICAMANAKTGRKLNTGFGISIDYNSR